MLKDAGAKNLEEAVKALEKIIEAIQITEKKIGEISLEKALEKACPSKEGIKVAMEAISSETKSPEFLIDMWCEESGRTKEQVMKALSGATERIKKTIRENRHPDNVPELLSGERKFGLIFLPRKLMIHLYELGVEALEIKARRKKVDENLESLAIEVFEEAGEWVSYCREQWGPPPDSELIPVSSAPLNNTRDEQKEPPF